MTTADDGPEAPPQTDVHRALEAITDERTAVAARIEAFETFERRVRELPSGPSAATAAATAERSEAGSGGPVTTEPPAVTTRMAAAPESNHCAAVREAFCETILPHTTADIDGDDLESVGRALETELESDIAAALVTESGWTAELKRAILERALEEQRKARRLDDMFETEAASLRRSIDDLEPICAWVESRAEQSLREWGFEELRAAHERLDRFQERLETALEERQQLLSAPIRRETRGTSARPYRTFVESIYTAGAVQYPVLSTGARLVAVCRSCQRTLRDHLVRRV